MKIPIKLIFILAGNAKQAELYCRQNKLRLGPYVRYLNSNMQLRGIAPEHTTIVKTGEFWKNPIINSDLLDRFLEVTIDG